ncbi:MotA/TolQ/ExbB proton channel family protein [Oceanipulchritudo coccoides]|nr:MotA/TolQ/ExbB proton channel family protein [Oceanipulchritudo coccoides]
MPLAQITLFELLQQGGWAMYPLGCLSMTLFALILFSWMQTSRGHFGLRPSRWTDRPLTRQLEDKLGPLQTKSGTARQREKTEDFLNGIEGNTLRWIQYMNVIATIAPMVGLLGTVSGMIGAFQTIATGGMGKPELLAGDIGEALITTATGLTIGIPAMIFYFMLRNRLDARLEEFEEWLEETSSGSGIESKPVPQGIGPENPKR